MCHVQIIEYDCLLLEHVFGQRPDDAQKVKQFVLDTIASDPGLQQTELVFLGLFGRACRVLENRNKEVITAHIGWPLNYMPVAMCCDRRAVLQKAKA